MAIGNEDKRRNEAYTAGNVSGQSVGKNSQNNTNNGSSQKENVGAEQGTQTKNGSLNTGKGTEQQKQTDIEFILDIPLEITAELGRTEIQVSELLKLSQGSIIEFTKHAGETLDVLANQKLIARGEVVVSNEKYGIRLTEIAPFSERIETLR